MKLYDVIAAAGHEKAWKRKITSARCASKWRSMPTRAVKTAVEKLFKVKVTEVRTATFDGSCGAGDGSRASSTWKKAYVKLKKARRRRFRGDK